LTRYFWRNFFSILLYFIAVAQWVCGAWIAEHLFGIRIGWPIHLLGPPVIFAVNVAILRRGMPRPGVRWTLRRVYTGIAFTSIFGLIFLLLLAAVAGLAWACVALAVALGVDISPAGLGQLFSNVGTAGLLVVAALFAYAYGLGQRRLMIRSIDVPLSHLTVGSDGLRLAQISDIHLGPYMSPERLAGYVERVNALEPDLICITGDITDGLDHAAESFPVLGRLRARHGVFAILGNHDVYTGADAVTEALGVLTPIHVLRDEVATIDIAGDPFHIIGLNDHGLDWARGVRHLPLLEQLVKRIPDGEPYIVLSHRPDLFDHAARLGAGLMLSGHTHGGQLALPWLGDNKPSLARFITRYPRGTFERGGSFLHVNLGLGVTGQPVRLATPREITMVTLRQRGV